MNLWLARAALVAALIVVGWITAGYLHTQPLAASMTALIGAFFLGGALELRRFRHDTSRLDAALAALQTPPATLQVWLETLPAGLRSAVRARLDGTRAALPGPALAPALAGLLVLLGMLGTFVGLVGTLRGTGLALETATDLARMRDALAAPVQGLGLAFGASVAGVATSAALGLMTALARADRLAVTRRLDACLGSVLHPFTAEHRRDEALRVAQQQAEALPRLVDAVQTLAARLQQQHEEWQARTLGQQERFHAEATSAYRGLAATVAESLDRAVTRSLDEGTRATVAAVQPIVASTLADLAREHAAWQQRVGDLARQGLDGALQGFDQRAQTLLLALDRRQADALTALATHGETLSRDASALHARIAEASAQHLHAVAGRLDEAVVKAGDAWQQAIERQDRQGEALAAQSRQTLATATAALQQQSQALLQALVEREAGRQGAWTAELQAMGRALRDDWQRAGGELLAQQQALARTLGETARTIAARTEAQAAATVAEIGRLAAQAAEAPRAAADLVAQLREKLADTLARDAALLAERERAMTALQALLESLQHTAGEQQAAVASLVDSSSSLLDRVGTRLAEQADREAARLEDLGARLSAGAVEVASLGEAFGAAVGQFERTGEKLTAQLQRIEAALGRSLARSDEQLAYYVAQAREVIDLSLGAQQQVLADLQRLSRTTADAA